jgi:T-complex protein 1 subunit epsilon
MAANIDPNSAVYATDEYGRPFIIVREGQQKSRLSGIAAIRVIITYRTCFSKG